MNPSYDLIVIGGGAGHSAATKAVSLGLACALIEKGPELGGLCILRGCMPSKTLIESANRLREMRDGERFGLSVTGAAADPEAIRQRLHRLTGEFRAERQKEMQSSGYDLLRGEAAFVSPQEIEFRPADGHATRLSARAFLIATGSVIAIPGIEGLADTPYWTSDDVVQLPPIPKKLLVMGGGAIGMEAAHLFEGLGSEVTVMIRSGRVLREFEPEVSEAVERESEERGIRFLKNAKVNRVSHEEGLFTLHLKGGSTATADALLVATGRKPATEGIEASGVRMDDGRIVIDRHAATSVPHIFAAGDCASPWPVVHLALQQGEAAAINVSRLLHGRPAGPAAEWHPEAATTMLFTEPQVMKTGLDEAEARGQGYDPVSGRQDFNDFGKGMIAGSRHGFAKVIVDRTSRLILGGTGVGPKMAELGHLIQFAVSRRLTVEEYIELPHYHPTLAEAWQRAAEKAAGAAGSL